MTALAALIARDLRLSLRHGVDTLAALLFFMLTASLFPLAIGPAPETLARLAPADAEPETLARLVAGGGFPAASYRLSLLALLADGGDSDNSSPADGPIGEFMRLPLDVLFESATVKVGEDEIAAMSSGRVGPRGSLPPAEDLPALSAAALSADIPPESLSDHA